MAWRFIRLAKSADLLREFPSTCRALSPKAMSDGIDTIVMQEHGINLHKMFPELMDSWRPAAIGPHNLLSAFGWAGECQYSLRDTKTGDLLFVNNFYDGYPYNLVPTMESRTPLEQAAEGFNWLETVAFPGSFSWKFVAFPRPNEKGFEEVRLIPGITFHRGSCFYVRFRFRGDWSKRIDSKRLNGKRIRSKPLNEAEARLQAEYYQRVEVRRMKRR